MKPRQPINKQSKKRIAAIAAGEISAYPKRTPIKQKAYTIKRSPIKKSNTKIRVVQATDEDIRGLTKKLDTVFSQYIRLSNADKDWMVRCFVTGKKLHWSKAQCGHYISRAHMATRWMEENCHCQTPASNALHEENQEPYKQALIMYGGISLVHYLEEMGKRIMKFSAADIQEKIHHYETELEKLKQK